MLTDSPAVTSRLPQTRTRASHQTSDAARPWRAPRGRIAYVPRPGGERPALPRALPEAVRVLPRVLTMLTVEERHAFDAALADSCAATHLPSAAALGAALAAGTVEGVVVSAAALAAGGVRALAVVAGQAREFTATPLVVLVSGEVTPAVLVALGRSGARAVLDVRGPQGWGVVQTFWSTTGVRTLAQRARAELDGSLAEVSPGMRRFVLTLFEVPARVRTVRGFAPQFGVLPTTLMSRFFRAELPAPRSYLAMARLVRAALLLESPRWTVSAVAAELEYSSAQAFSRHLHLLLGVRPREFRRYYSAGRMLARFADDLLTPYMEQLRVFEPF